LSAARFVKALHDPPPRFCPVPIRDIDQAGDPPDQSVFIAGQHAVGIGYFPQHLDDANTFFFGEILDHDPGEMIEISSLDRTLFRRFDESDYLARFQAKASGQGTLDDALLAILDPIVATRYFDEQDGESESGIIPLAGSMGIFEPVQNAEQSVEHVRSR
jgi:hypothetical protein